MTDALFHWIILLRDVPDSEVKTGDHAVIVDVLASSSDEQESGYTVEVFRHGETLAVVSIPVSWVRVLPEVWGQAEASTIAANQTA